MTDPGAPRVSLKPRLWHPAKIERITEECGRVKTYTLRPSEPFEFIAGQHAEVRLTATDGYRAQRSYSISSAPEAAGTIDLTIERLDDGEVSPFFHEVVQEGDEIELRGPLGGHFIWSVTDGGPLFLVGGGSGVCPLMSMIRHRVMQNSDVPVSLLFSARTWDELLFREELLALFERRAGFELTISVTREPPPEGRGFFGRRIDADIVAEALGKLPGPPKHVFICGGNLFVEAAADGVMAAGIGAEVIRTERYGI
jgi:ferredoxin-NADP reductase